MNLTAVIREGKLIYVSKVQKGDKVVEGDNKKIPAMINRQLKNYAKKDIKE